MKNTIKKGYLGNYSYYFLAFFLVLNFLVKCETSQAMALKATCSVSGTCSSAYHGSYANEYIFSNIPDDGLGNHSGVQYTADSPNPKSVYIMRLSGKYIIGETQYADGWCQNVSENYGVGSYTNGNCVGYDPSYGTYNVSEYTPGPPASSISLTNTSTTTTGEIKINGVAQNTGSEYFDRIIWHFSAASSSKKYIETQWYMRTDASTTTLSWNTIPSEGGLWNVYAEMTNASSSENKISNTISFNFIFSPIGFSTEDLADLPSATGTNPILDFFNLPHLLETKKPFGYFFYIYGSAKTILDTYADYSTTTENHLELNLDNTAFSTSSATTTLRMQLLPNATSSLITDGNAMQAWYTLIREILGISVYLAFIWTMYEWVKIIILML